MEFINHTPFDGIAFEGITPKRYGFHVLALKQTLQFDEEGRLSLSDEQAPLSVVDTFAGQANQSSVIAESDFCHFKPKCDVLVVGSACAPGGVPVEKFPIRLRVQQASGEVLLNKVLIVTGARTFSKDSADGWKLGTPAPIDRLLLGYELAYGGENKVVDPETQQPVFHEFDQRNPIGIGFVHPEWLQHAEIDEFAAPQIETMAEPLLELGGDQQPVGLGAINKSWLPRRDLLGTIDEAFIESGDPLPHDFQSAYWNAAPLDQQTSHLHGDEVITLNNLTPEGEVRFVLPGDVIYALLRHEDGDIHAPPLKLDTVLIDTATRRVYLTWRLIVVKQPDRPLRLVELRFRDREADAELKSGIVRRLHEHVAAAEAEVMAARAFERLTRA